MHTSYKSISKCHRWLAAGDVNQLVNVTIGLMSPLGCWVGGRGIFLYEEINI